jgi:hypothetical protein
VKYTLDLHVRIEGTGILRFNQFNCSREKLPGLTAQWVYQVWREHGCRDMKVEKVTANEEDIYEEVMAIRKPPTIT